MSRVAVTFPQKLIHIASSPTCWLCLVDRYIHFANYMTSLCHGRDGAMKWSSWAGWHCGFIHKILILQETWCNPEGSMGGSVWLFLPRSGILAQEHRWILGFPHSFQVSELRSYRYSPAPYSRVIGPPSPG